MRRWGRSDSRNPLSSRGALRCWAYLPLCWAVEVLQNNVAWLMLARSISNWAEGSRCGALEYREGYLVHLGVIEGVLYATKCLYRCWCSFGLHASWPKCLRYATATAHIEYRFALRFGQE